MSSDAAFTGEPRTPESYAWPLVAVIAAILPQVLVPSGHRVGPPLIVPIMEAIAFVVMLLIAARPGPVPRGARPFILSLFCLLILSNAAAAVRLVLLVLDGGRVDGVALTASRLLVAGSLVLTTNIITFALLYWQLDSGGPAPDGSSTQLPTRTSSSLRLGQAGSPPQVGYPGSTTFSISPSPARSHSAPRTRCR